MKYVHYLMTILLIAMSGMVLFNLYQAFYPFKLLEIKSITIKTKVISPGGLLVYVSDYCKHTDQPAIVYRTLHRIDESRIETFPAVQSVSIPGCHKTEVTLQTYATILPGEYYLLGNAIFTLQNRTLQVPFKSDTFWVK